MLIIIIIIIITTILTVAMKKKQDAKLNSWHTTWPQKGDDDDSYKTVQLNIARDHEGSSEGSGLALDK